ncbi:MAG TPA: class I SAM-dependent methyltransferase [Thermoplasmata archaeon]|jgi:ubiquinone/menaquinone biosynthesis C-methylase UbiE
MSQRVVRDGYDTIAARYLEARARDSEDVRLLRELVERLPVNARVLDAGCGAGVPVALALSRQFEVVGVDFSTAQVRLGHREVPRVTFVRGDMVRSPFRGNAFDGICSYYAMIHVPRAHHAALLREFQRVLRPSGWMLACMGYSDEPDHTEADYFGCPMFWSHYDAETNLGLLRESGFSVAWSKPVRDASDPAAVHLFVLAQRT